VDNWKKLTNSRNRVRKKSFSTFHIIGLDTGGLVFLVSGCGMVVEFLLELSHTRGGKTLGLLLLLLLILLLFGMLLFGLFTEPF
jgi:hypothetical protein